MADEAYEILKASVEKRVNSAIEQVQSFLLPHKTYCLVVEPDIFSSGRIWFIKAVLGNSCIVLLMVIDADYEVANHIMLRLGMMLLVLGLSVQPSNLKEFEFSAADWVEMNEWEKVLRSSDIHVSYISIKDHFAIRCQSDNKEINLIDISTITEKGISIVCKQIAIILGGLGKYFSTSDKTVGNKYGIVDFCP